MWIWVPALYTSKLEIPITYHLGTSEILGTILYWETELLLPWDNEFWCSTSPSSPSHFEKKRESPFNFLPHCPSSNSGPSCFIFQVSQRYLSGSLLVILLSMWHKVSVPYPKLLVLLILLAVGTWHKLDRYLSLRIGQKKKSLLYSICPLKLMRCKPRRCHH